VTEHLGLRCRPALPHTVWLLALLPLQEYLLLNKVGLEVIFTVGAADTTLSQAVLDWLDLEGDMQWHRASSYAHPLIMGAMEKRRMPRSCRILRLTRASDWPRVTAQCSC
jgi:hypothetical protein